MKISKKTGAVTFAAGTAALCFALYAAVKPAPDFWEENKFAPLKTPEALAMRGELVQRFANNNVTGYATSQDKCVAHSLAYHEEDLKSQGKELDTADSFFATTYIMLKCARGEKPAIF